MGWGDILKGKVGLNASDISMIEYIMKDGIARSVKGLMEDIYNEIAITRRLPENRRLELAREIGRPRVTKFNGSNYSIKHYFTTSPDYESRKIATNEVGSPILEYRYVGE